MKKNILRFLGYLFLATLIWSTAYNYLDTDLGWHLKAGQDILANQQIIGDQNYLWTLTNYQWFNHEWLSDLIVFKLYHSLGYHSLIIYFTLIVLSAWLIINHTFYRLSGQRPGLWVFIWELLATFAMRPQLGIRIQLITLPLFALLLHYLLVPTKNQKLGYGLLFLLFYTWTCLHGSFIFGLAVLGLFAVFELINNWRQQTKTWQRLIALLIASLASLVTPLGLKILTILPSHLNGNLSRYISEWRPIYYQPFQFWQIGLIGVVLGLLAVLVLEKKANLKNASLWLSIILVVMAVSAIRHFSLMAISVPVLLGIELAKLMPKSKSLPKLALGFIAFVLMLSTASIALNTNVSLGDPFNYYCRRFPCASVNYLKDHPELINKRWLSHYNFGGYLIWTLPEAKLYADGRLPYAKRQGKLLIADFMEFNDSKLIAQKLTQEKIELVLWSKLPSANDQLSRSSKSDPKSESALVKYLQSQSDWQLVFEDYASLIFVKKTANGG